MFHILLGHRAAISQQIKPRNFKNRPSGIAGSSDNKILRFSFPWHICLLQLIHAFCYLVVSYSNEIHDDVIKWKHFPRYWPFVRGIHRSPVNSPHKGQWRGTLMFSLICVWINDWVNNRKTGDLRRYRGHYDVTVIYWQRFINEHPKLGINKIGWYHSAVNLRLTHGYVIISPNLWCEVIILQYLNLWGG